MVSVSTSNMTMIQPITITEKKAHKFKSLNSIDNVFLGMSANSPTIIEVGCNKKQMDALDYADEEDVNRPDLEQNSRASGVDREQ